MKLAHSGGSPGNFFVRKDKTTDRGGYQNKRDGADNCVSKEGKTPSVEDGRGVLSMNKILKYPQTGGSPGVFFARHDKNICHGGFQTRKKVKKKSIPEALATKTFITGREVLSMNKNLIIPQTGGSPGVFPARQDKKKGHGGVQTRKTVADKSISEAVTTTSFGAGRGVSVKKKKLKLEQRRKSPGVFFSAKTKHLKLTPTVAEVLAKFWLVLLSTINNWLATHRGDTSQKNHLGSIGLWKH